MVKIHRTSIADLPDTIERTHRPSGAIKTGIVHFGAGAFHRAHQADYIDRLLETDPRWGIAAVSLRTADMVDALKAQDFVYSLSILDREPSTHIIAAHSDAIGPDESAKLRTLLAQSSVKIVTSTVTEKGYCLDGDGTLDLAHPDIVHDLQNPASPRSVVGWIVAGLRDRHAAGIAPYAVLCCDNLSGNGDKLRAACVALASQIDPEIAAWIDAHVAFPNSMVDSITPASDKAFLRDVQSRLGAHDAAAVQREGFTQWVIERFELEDGPDLASVGVTITDDVLGYEQAKLRIVNGAHSALAYIGSRLGLETVHEAVSDPSLEAFVRRMIQVDVLPCLRAVPGLDSAAYADAVFARFHNPAIRHLLSQIAWDGSQKLPHRTFNVIQEALDAGREIDRLVVPIAAWIAFVRDKAQQDEAIIDPLADLIGPAASASDPVTEMLALRQVFPEKLAEDSRFRHALAEAVIAFLEGQISPLLDR